MAVIQISAPGLVALQQGFERAPIYTREAMLVAMTEATQFLEREVKDALPAVSGLTRASVTSDAFSTSAGVLGVVGSASVAAAAVELGTRPHMPPVEPLIGWVQEKLGVSAQDARGVAFAVAMKIRRHGTKAQAPFRKTLDRQAAALGRIFEGAAQAVATRLANDVNGGLA